MKFIDKCINILEKEKVVRYSRAFRYFVLLPDLFKNSKYFPTFQR